MHHLRELRHYTMLPTLWKHAAPLPSLRAFSTSPSKTSTPSFQSPSPPTTPQRYAIIGGGFAGVAVAWHLMKHSSLHNPIQIELFDAYGLGAGGSGAAAGLLHPYTPRGTFLWQGLPAFQASLDVINAAEADSNTLDSELQQKSRKRKQFVWRHGLLRPARNAKQAKDFLKNGTTNSTTRKKEDVVCDARCIQSYDELLHLVPGLDPQLLFSDAGNKGDRMAKRMESKTTGAGAEKGDDVAVGFFTEQGVVINPQDYLTALWESCLFHASTSSPLASAQLHLRSVLSLAELDAQDGPFDGIVVAAGAAVDSIVETAGVLKLDLCQGYTLDMELPEEESKEKGLEPSFLSQTDASHTSGSNFDNSSLLRKTEETTYKSPKIDKMHSVEYPEGAPGLLGSPYISPQGTHRAIVGATQRHDCSLNDAVTALGPGSLQKRDSKEWNEAIDVLLPAAAQLWPPIGLGYSSSPSSSESTSSFVEKTIGDDDSTDSANMPSTWQAAAVRSGYRAIPQRTAEGSIPYAGKLNSNTDIPVDGSGSSTSVELDSDADGSRNWWVVGGLGARGLVYHGWLGKFVADGMLAKNDEQLPIQLKRWKEKNSKI